MKKRFTLLCLALAACLAGCKYDDTDIWNAVNEQEERIAALEALINTTDYITSVSPILQSGDTIGYTISFLQSDPISIYHGNDGDSLFQSMTVGDDYVVFVLTDGTTFEVPRYKGSLLTFYLEGTELTDLTQTIDVSEGDLTYTVVTGSGDVSVRILEGEGWSATAANGTITVNPGSIGDGGTALLEVTLTENGKVTETYRLTVTRSQFLTGKGTADNPYRISSKDILRYLEEQTAAGETFEGEYFAMTNDIDLEDEDVQIGTFSGTFDGKGYTIRNLNINVQDASSAEWIALFKELYSGTVSGSASSDCSVGGVVALANWYSEELYIQRRCHR